MEKKLSKLVQLAIDAQIAYGNGFLGSEGLRQNIKRAEELETALTEAATLATEMRNNWSGVMRIATQPEDDE